MVSPAMEEEKSLSIAGESVNHAEDNNHGWQKVTYAKKQRKNQDKKGGLDSNKSLTNVSVSQAEKSTVFQGLEKHAEERRRKLEAQRAAAGVYEDDEIPRRSGNNRRGENDDDEFSSDADVGNGVAEVNKKEKPKKVKKPKITVAEAAAKIDADDLASFLSSVLEAYEGQQDIQLMRFADYFGRAFSAASASQFPWLKLFREFPVSKIADIPVSYISDAVYKTSVDWINHRSYEALGAFVVWSLDCILADLSAQLVGSKGAKKGGQAPSSKSQVAIFLVLAMVLRRKPDVLINVLPKLRENMKYQGQDKLPVIIWMVVQACQGDLAIGLYLWSHHILPILGGKSGSNLQSRSLVLQLVERILETPKARSIVVSNAVKKGERLVPPAALDLLLQLTFPASSARVKATERFLAVYPVLKEVALAGTPGSKAMKQVSIHIQTLAMKAAGEGIPELSGEATGIFIWCLTQNPDCYKQWDKVYVENIEASVAALRKLSEGWKAFSSKNSFLKELEETLRSFRQKNEKELSGVSDASCQSLFKDADKDCKILLGRVSTGGGCLKTAVVSGALFAVVAAVMSPYVESLDLSKLLSVLFNPSI